MSKAIDSGQGKAASSAAFKKLLNALLEQYERDIVEAVGQARAEPGQVPGHVANQKASNADVKLSRVQPSADLFDESLRSTGLAWHEQMEREHSPSQSSTPDTVLRSLSTSPGGPSPPAPSGTIRRPSKSSNGSTMSSLNIPKAAPAPSSTVDKVHDQLRKSSKEGIASRKSSKEPSRSSPDTAIGKFVRSPLFDKFSAVLLVANAVFIGVQVEYGFQAQMPAAIDVIDYVFCVCFVIELLLRFCGYGCQHFWTDPEDRAWNWFDFTIVVLSTFDTLMSVAAAGEESPFPSISVLRVIRVLRIVRVLRVIRVMRFFRDLRVLLSAIVSTIKTASFALILIVFIMYMFGIAITQLVAEYVREQQKGGTVIASDDDLMFFFGGIFRSIFSLFMTIAGGIDWKDAAVPLFEVGELAIFFFLLYVALMILCVMNVLLGIFCQCALDTAAVDKENVIQLQLQEKSRFVETLQTLFAGWDDSGDGKCSLEEFANHLSDETTQALLSSLEIEGRDAVMLFELLDADGSGEVDLNEFVTGCITLRGGAKAVHMEKVNNMNRTFTERFSKLEETVVKLVEKIEKISSDWPGASG
eukprot:gb/GFBE01042003.1/.p1 GENE.gb/GFBE01042003.1/~~gb/GFBE01042003.1/.p1  ORF type:complete len:585 (+),score=109.87 gb/GFBE01042003.1/:1-1755(+)